MKLRILTGLLLISTLVTAAFAQNPATFGSSGGRYGLSAWAINNQRVASQYNYDVDSQAGGTAIGAGAYSFPLNTLTQALAFGGGRNVNPFATNASVKIVDISSSLTETVTLSSVTYSGGLATLNMSPANTHTSFHLRSGTCGLREALNDMGTNGGVVIVDQKFYDDGCLQTTITGLAVTGPLYQNQYVLDISNGQNTWYALRPTATTLIASGAAPTMGTVAGGTFTNGNVIGTYTYVDALGNESLPSSETTQASGGTTNGITMTSPAAATGAVGYRVYLTAVGGGTGTEILYSPTSTNCTLTTLENLVPACAIGANFSVLAPVTSTSKQPTIGMAHSAIAFQPMSFVPQVSPSSQLLGAFLPYSFNNAAQGTLNSGATASEDLAYLAIPAGYFNTIGKSYQVCAKIATATQVATAVPVVKLQMSTAYLQSPVTLSTLTFATQTQAAAGTIQGCWIITTAATGASGTFWSSSPTLWTNTLNSTPAQTVAGSVDVTTAVSSAVDLTKNVYLSLNLANTVAANITAPQALQFTFTPLGAN
jgi:hypothetical protein